VIEAVGDIWAISTSKDIIVVTTNCGWREDGRAVMGAGLAREAARRYPWLPSTYGAYLQEAAARRDGSEELLLHVRPEKTHKRRWCAGLILFPTKPLDRVRPWKSWWPNSDIALIQRGLLALRTCGLELSSTERALILVPSLGCSNGGLSETDVVPLMAAALPDACFVHVRARGVDATG